VDSKNLELPWKKPRSSVSPPTEKKGKKSLPVHLTPTFLNCISLRLPVCLSVVHKQCCKTRTFSSLLTVPQSACHSSWPSFRDACLCATVNLLSAACPTSFGTFFATHQFCSPLLRGLNKLLQ
jgi:hypothetical protein